MEQILVNGSFVNGGSGQIDDKIMKDLKSDLDNCQNQLKSKASEIAGLTSINERLKLEVEEKVHDLKMAQKNMDHLKEMLEEKSNTTESQQQERLQNIAALQDLQSNIRQLMHERDEVQIKANDKDRQLAELRKEANDKDRQLAELR